MQPSGPANDKLTAGPLRGGRRCSDRGRRAEERAGQAAAEGTRLCVRRRGVALVGGSWCVLVLDSGR